MWVFLWRIAELCAKSFFVPKKIGTKKGYRCHLYRTVVVEIIEQFLNVQYYKKIKSSRKPNLFTNTGN